MKFPTTSYSNHNQLFGRERMRLSFYQQRVKKEDQGDNFTCSMLSVMQSGFT
jgi:hypothetical protein